MLRGCARVPLRSRSSDNGGQDLLELALPAKSRVRVTIDWPEGSEVLTGNPTAERMLILVG